jgi:poly(A) polymerase
MIDAGVMAHVVVEADRVDGLSKMIELERALGLPPDPIRRLVALTGTPSTKLVADLKAGLRLSNKDADHFAAFAGQERRLKLIARNMFGRALYGARPDWARDAAMLSAVETGKPDPKALAQLNFFVPNWVQPHFPLSGADLQKAGIEPGPEMGRILTELADWWVAADFVPDRVACLARLRDSSKSR